MGGEILGSESPFLEILGYSSNYFLGATESVSYGVDLHGLTFSVAILKNLQLCVAKFCCTLMRHLVADEWRFSSNPLQFSQGFLWDTVGGQWCRVKARTPLQFYCSTVEFCWQIVPVGHSLARSGLSCHLFCNLEGFTNGPFFKPPSFRSVVSLVRQKDYHQLMRNQSQILECEASPRTTRRPHSLPIMLLLWKQLAGILCN